MSAAESQILELGSTTSVAEPQIGMRRKSRDSRTPGVCQILNVNRSRNFVSNDYTNPNFT